MLLLSQALFAAGQHVEAAGALQAALQMLPEDKWGTVVVHYTELYPNIQNYTDQLRAVEKLRDANAELPALHLLLGYHFGYLGYPKQAVKELKKTLELSPKDEIAQAFRHVFVEAGRPAQAGRSGAGNAARNESRRHEVVSPLAFDPLPALPGQRDFEFTLARPTLPLGHSTSVPGPRPIAG